MKKLLTSLLTISLFVLLPINSAEAKSVKITLGKSEGSCDIVRWGPVPNYRVKVVATWNTHYTKPVKIQPSTLTATVTNGSQRINITGYDVTLYVKNQPTRHMSKSQTSLNSYIWLANIRTSFYKALDYPQWRVKIYTSKGSCTTWTHYVSW